MRPALRSCGLIGAVALLVAGCSSDQDEAGDTSGVDAPGDAAVQGGLAVGVTPSPVARWGSGRATFARYDPVSQRTAVVTTVELSVVDDDGTGEKIGGELTERPGRVATSADGRLLAIAGESSGTVTAWDLTTGEPIGVPFATNGPVARLEFVPHASAVIVSTPASVTRLPLDGSEPTVLVDDVEGPLGPAAVAPDGSWIVVPVESTELARIAVWRPEGLSTVDLPDGVNAQDVVASPDGTRIGVVTASRDDPFEGNLVIWDVVNGSLLSSISLVDGAGSAVWAFGPDGRVLAADGSVTTLWGPAGEQMLALDLSAENPVQSIASIGPDRGFLTVLQDGTIDVWDRDGNRLATLGEPGTTLADVTVAPDGNTVTTVDFYGEVRRWEIGSPSAPPVVVVGGVGVVNSVSFAPDGKAVAVATSSGRVETFDDSGAVIRSFDQTLGNVDSVAFSPDSTVVASAMGERRGLESFDDTVTLFDAQTGGEEARFGGEAEQVPGCAFFRNEVRFSPTGGLLAANSHDFTVSLYDASDGAIVHTFAPHLSTVTDLAFSPTGDKLATTSDDSTLRVWSVVDRQLLKEYATPPGGYWSLVFGADGRTLVVSDLVGTVSVLDVETGSVIRTFTGTKNRVAELAISPDGSLVASGADDNSVEVWSTESGELLAQLPGHTSPVRTVAFSPDGALLVSGSADATVRLWELQVST